jgi:energy-coupling factor transporter ATP-binding protein EcfA2
MMDYWPYESGIRFPLKEKNISFPENFMENHSLVLGKTGTGKSNLLAQLIKMYEEEGKTVIVFDPHGELWKYGGSDSSIISLSPLPGEVKRYLKFNMMTVLPYRNEREKLINEDLVVQTLKEIFSSEETFSIGTWGPRIELIFTIIPRLLLKYKINPTLQDLSDILLNYYKRKDFASSLEPEEKTELFSIFNQGYDFISSSVNKILPLISNEISRHLFSSSEDFYDISKFRKTLYVELAGEYSPSSLSKPFSIMLLYKIWNNIILRRMKDVVIVIDEFQTITPHISQRIIAEGRKFSMWIVMATQSLSALNPILTSNIRTNVHNFFLFQLSEEDSRLFKLNGKVLKNPEFHNFNCYVPGTESYFTGSAKLATQRREFSTAEEFYAPDVESRSETDDRTEDIDPMYLNHLVSLGLASIVDGNISLSEEYFEKIGSRPRKGGESIFHRYLITRTYFFFKKRGYEVYEGIELNGHRPDLVIVKGDEKIAVECEYSDIDKRSRIMEKKKFYSNVIFSAFKGSEGSIPSDTTVLLIPAIGENSEPEYLDNQNERGT